MTIHVTLPPMDAGEAEVWGARCYDPREEPLKPLRYAVVGGPPADWYGLLIVDENGNAVQDVVEVDCDEGWVKVVARDDRGKIYDGKATQRIEGRFWIVR